MSRQKLLREIKEARQTSRPSGDAREAFNEFAAIIAHDLSAPLRLIAGFSQLLEEQYRQALDEKAHHYIHVIHESSRKAQGRLAALLQYSRLDTVPLVPARVDCGAAANHALMQLKESIEAREAMIRLGTLPTLIADRERLGLLFYVLIDNALKFCAGRPDIVISARRGYEAWIFLVQDNGIGIDPQYHQAVFDVFRRLHGEEEYSGIGMGLALARRIAMLHGGIIRLESCEGQGATFFFSLPDLPDEVI